MSRGRTGSLTPALDDVAQRARAAPDSEQVSHRSPLHQREDARLLRVRRRPARSGYQ